MGAPAPKEENKNGGDSRFISAVKGTEEVENKVLQKELHEYMLQSHPVEHRAALESAGNMHNPKVIALRDAFGDAILSTQLVQNINRALSTRCERISSTNFDLAEFA